jgi:hypothetical protein
MSRRRIPLSLLVTRPILLAKCLRLAWLRFRLWHLAVTVEREDGLPPGSLRTEKALDRYLDHLATRQRWMAAQQVRAA